MNIQQEKSCGAVLYRINQQGERQYLGVLNRSHKHWGFPKGHVENSETEQQTAQREVLEETGLTFSFVQGFRHAVQYTMPNGISKQVVYFLGIAEDATPIAQESEIADLGWMGAQQLMQLLGFENDRQTLKLAEQFVDGLEG